MSVLKSFLAIAAFSFLAAATASAQQRELNPHSTETLTAVARFFDYDATVPLDAHVTSTDRVAGFVREKIVFTGSRGDRVPAFLSMPGDEGPWPIILLMHAGASSKEAWWASQSYEHGREVTEPLLIAGFAVFMMDAQNHGERTANIDHVPIQTLYFTNEWWSTFRDMVVETTADYRRALQYLRGREDLDRSRIGVVGQSMGALTGIYLAAVEPDVKVIVAGAAALSPEWLFPLSPINFAPALSDQEVLLIAAREDSLVDPSWTERLFSLIPSDEKQLVYVDGGHRLSEEYVPLALDWVRSRLR